LEITFQVHFEVLVLFHIFKYAYFKTALHSIWYRFLNEFYLLPLTLPSSVGLRSKKNIRGRRGRDHMVVGFTTTYAIKPITTDVVGSNLAQGDVYNI
jgi:hypothetical protein